ncbi:MAG: M56 family metallopeptidase [Lachnospiraceae bacterium]|nr:M56 family metallopeptidase [Lachnospiraceae bacterium]
MNILFAMTISGSIVFLLYLITKPIANRLLSAHWQYNFLRICLLFYLIPYQCFQKKYLILYNFLFETGEAANSVNDGIAVFKGKNTIYITSDGRLHYKYWIPLLIFSIVWLSIITIILYSQIKKYRACRNNLLQFSEISDVEAYDMAKSYQSTTLPERTKRARIMLCPFVKSPFTIGFLYPIIVLPEQNNMEDLSLYLSHELSHIRNHDALWKSIAFLTMLIHWYNPLAYFLFYELCVACEKNCDEMVTQPLDETQKVHYENLIIEAAKHKSDIGTLFVDAFFTNKKQTKERILFMTRKNHKSHYRKIITALVIFLAVLSMPISVLAYQPISVYHDIPSYELNEGIGDMYIIPDDTPSPFELDSILMQLDFTLSDEIIIDEYGNKYTITVENKEAARACSHEYINASRNHHIPSGRGCTIYIYKGIYCKKCSFCLQESLDNQLTYSKCPH